MIKKDAYKPNLFLKTSDNLTVIAQSIIALSESLLKEKSLNNNLGRRRQILMLKESALNMRELVADIQELSLLETGEKSYQLEHFHLHEIFKVIVPLVYGIIGDKAIKFNLAIQDDLPMVYADRRKIREVVMNFLENAVCFTDLGNITLKASTEQNMVKISIQDTGVGIRPEEIRAIFRGFKTTGGSIPLEYEGSGLRLNINKRIIESHGGKIGVKSKVGEGTTFYFTLRARPFEEVTPSTDLETNSDEYNLMEPETSSPESSKDDYQFTGPVSDTDRMIQIGENELIMVVDDSPTSREMIASILTDYNYQAITAANGKEAWIRYFKISLIW